MTSSSIDPRIRPARPEDAAAVVALRALVHPYLVRGVESTRRMIADPPPGEQWVAFVAEAEGVPVGWASAFHNLTTSTPDLGEISLLHVHPEHRGRGLGDALFRAAHGHLAGLGIRSIRTWSSPESLGFARRHGFEPSRQAVYSKLDLDGGPLEGAGSVAAPSLRGDHARSHGRDLRERANVHDHDGLESIELVPLSHLDPRELYAADIEATADEPGDVPYDAVSYETWCYEVWDNIGLEKDLSTAALIGPTVVAFALVKRDGPRMWSDMTATLPEHRGRGLARLVKTATLHRAAAAGVTQAFTSNDESNAPMIAINRRLGYRPVATQISCLARIAGPAEP